MAVQNENIEIVELLLQVPKIDVNIVCILESFFLYNSKIFFKFYFIISDLNSVPIQIYSNYISNQLFFNFIPNSKYLIKLIFDISMRFLIQNFNLIYI